MTPLLWMTGASVASWAVVSLATGARVHPELLWGMLGPLGSACATWMAVVRTHRAAPERVLGVLVAGFAAKMVFFGAYVVVMLRVADLRPVPFVAAFTSYLIGLYMMEALFLKRLTTVRQSDH